ncbi:hypothetical protein M433DRAFT_1048 [Acidomyces richmondensis BFW]|nr:MAG: hypothetical protein FE78DRAFT_33951 [Acidomyces sp. 'richmondensis']KYG49479.1 hypothetical protein M433DRAFT_1048 [Acidomyces richmondensis BFW]
MARPEPHALLETSRARAVHASSCPRHGGSQNVRSPVAQSVPMGRSTPLVWLFSSAMHPPAWSCRRAVGSRQPGTVVRSAFGSRMNSTEAFLSPGLSRRAFVQANGQRCVHGREAKVVKTSQFDPPCQVDPNHSIGAEELVTGGLSQSTRGEREKKEQ